MSPFASLFEAMGNFRRLASHRGLGYAARAAANRLAPRSTYRRLSAPIRTKWPALNIDDVFDLLDSPRNCGLVYAMQIRSEFSSLLEAFRRLGPKTILEIGTAKGGTLFAFTALAGEGADIISVDLPAGRFGGGGFWLSARWRMYEDFSNPNQRLSLIRADSHSPAALAEVKQILDGKPVDFLFIDGDHSYEGVKRDYEMYSPLVRPGGMIAFHDITGSSPELVGGVPVFWRELKAGREVVEFIDSPNQNGFGIGVLTVPAASNLISQTARPVEVQPA